MHACMHDVAAAGVIMQPIRRDCGQGGVCLRLRVHTCACAFHAAVRCIGSAYWYDVARVGLWRTRPV